MTVLARYLASVGQPDMFESSPVFDEFAAPDGKPRRGWGKLLDGLTNFAENDLIRAQSEVARLLEDDGVTYTPGPAATHSMADAPVGEAGSLAEPRPWQLDPLPLIVDEREWSALEAGMVQRAELMDAILADLYGAQSLLAERHLPVAAVFDHAEFLRALVGTDALTSQGLFMIAVDLGRDADGVWKVMSDRTQAPSGAGYAMQNRRVVSRVLPEVYSAAHLHRLTPFFQAMRTALLDAAPKQVEDPRVVVLSPGTHSETAFDQAFLASLLGFPLLEGSDLTVRDGRVWMRVLGKLEQVDVILRRVDSLWMDALELRPGSRLGVTGLVQCVRQGTVSVVNNIGSGVLENPALLQFLPDLCERLLGQPLRLPSVETWWCGDPEGLAYVAAHLDDLVIRPISRDQGRSVRGSALDEDQRQRVLAKIEAAPHRYVGQQVVHLSVAPTTEAEQLVRRNVVLRSFAVRTGHSYTAMLGGLARVTDDGDGSRGVLVTAPGGGLAKDVWVVSSSPLAPARPAPARARRPDDEQLLSLLDSTIAAMVPRVLSDLFWLGRYGERAEDLLRLILAARTVAIETNWDHAPGGALAVLLPAITHVSTTYPGFVTPGRAMMPEFRSLLLDRHRNGSVAQAIGALSLAAQGVRDQLSEDVWMVLADIERALAALSANPYDQGLQLTDASERVLSGLLALAGISGENMVRDAGWYMLDIGRGLERGLQVVALLKASVGTVHGAENDRMILEAVLTAAESIVTFRRRNRGRDAAEALIELLVTDPHNPRSVAYQLDRIAADLRAIPHSSPTARPLRLVETTAETLHDLDPVALTTASGSVRTELMAFLSDLQDQLRTLSDAIRNQYHPLPPAPKMWRASWNDVS
jgi:uncharacterized circularly permuted ATP-grasp superfamily protein/uncharacterized alpha-E superfamily protein